MRIKSLVLTLAAIQALAAFAFAAPPPGPLDPIIAEWFRTLTNPKTGAFCCDTSDGHILATENVRTAGDEYLVRFDGAWHRVPKDAVLDRIDNPTGQPVVFAAGNVIFCFVRPAMT